MSDIALYRKYRSKNFEEVVGQDHVKQTLINALISNKVNHAYLFSGPRGVGKTTIGRLLAKSVNCKNLQDTKGEPCEKCESCIEISGDKSVDLVEIDAASNRGIDEMRELREKIKYRPTKLDYRVFIIDEVHMLTTEAFNALLKTLEEPPKHIIFILATTEPQKIPATILSRCQRFDFKRLSVEEIAGHLKNISTKEKLQIDEKALRLIAVNSDGSGRDCLSILSQVSAAFGDEKVTSDMISELLGLASSENIYVFIRFIASKDVKKTLEYINELIYMGYSPAVLLDSIITQLRKLLIYINIREISDNIIEVSDDEVEVLKELSKLVTTKDIVTLINLIIEAKTTQKYTQIPQLPLEIVALKYIDKNEVKSDVTSVSSRPLAKSIEKKEVIVEPANEVVTPEVPAIKLADSKKNNETIEDQPSEEKSSSKDKTKAIAMEYSEIERLWPDIVKDIVEKNYSLGIFLKSMKPISKNENRLMLSTGYSFHKDCLDKIENKKAVEDSVCNVCHAEFIVECSVDENQKKEQSVAPAVQYEEPAKENSNLLGDAMDVLGGEVAGSN